MGRTRRRFSREFKISLLRELEIGKPVAQLTRENEIHPGLLARWKKEFSEDPENAFRGNGNMYKEQARVAKLERLVGQLYAENEFLKKVLNTLEKTVQEERRRLKEG